MTWGKAVLFPASSPYRQLLSSPQADSIFAQTWENALQLLRRRAGTDTQPWSARPRFVFFHKGAVYEM